MNLSTEIAFLSNNDNWNWKERVFRSKWKRFIDRRLSVNLSWKYPFKKSSRTGMLKLPDSHVILNLQKIYKLFNFKFFMNCHYVRVVKECDLKSHTFTCAGSNPAGDDIFLIFFDFCSACSEMRLSFSVLKLPCCWSGFMLLDTYTNTVHFN